MTHTHHAAFQSYGVLLIVILAASLYVQGWLHVRRTYPQVLSGWRAASFLLGLFLIWLASSSPMTGYVHEFLTAHMVQHLLIMTIAAPLIWLGEPLMPIMHGLPWSVIRLVVLPVLR